jgi:pimeloyl-ACP methyl ester carboxylesterase
MKCLAPRCLPLVFAALTCNVVGCATLRRTSQADSTIAFMDAAPSVAATSDEPLPTEPIVQPARAAPAQLLFLDPYQPGKVPVVLIHGLFSSPEDWADAIGHLRAAPGFADRFQIWAFGYPTGQGFLQSAAALRIQLRAAVDALDPQRIEPSLHRIVLVGHSMGGLIAKLQVTYSEELVWSRLANRPLEEVVTTDATRTFLAETCYFDPSLDVARVILIASPHRGSLYSSAIVGHCVSTFIQPTPQQANMHEQLMRDNPRTFNPVVERRFPTSIDMLVPSSPLLDAMREMRLRQDVALHTILGVSHPLSLDGPSDGVVSVHSASHPGCQSILAVNAHHPKVHHRLETSLEILRILSCDASMTSAPAQLLPPGVGIQLPNESGNKSATGRCR